MKLTHAPKPTDFSDSELVRQSLAGEREAFGGIVARYQSLLCSLAYSATGNLSQSEDLAQETFVTAWKQLAGLREPERLRWWLCRIARNHACDALRRQGHEPSHQGKSLKEIEESAAPEPLPSQSTITREEEAILWRTMERIPESYREPLILFYREHRSIEHVAAALDLSEDAVKQRLSRGRKLLHEQVLAFVEGTLERSNPGKAFTMAVIAALPALATPAKAAGLGAATAEGGATAKAAAAGGLTGATFAPALGFLGIYFAYRSGLAGAQSEAERIYIQRFYGRLLTWVLGYLAIGGLLLFTAKQFVAEHHLRYSALAIWLVLPFTMMLFASGMFRLRAPRKFLAELTAKGVTLKPAKPAWEYRSKFTLLGLPFIHIRVSGTLAVPVVPVKAWIASGDCAMGLLFASGSFALAPVCIGASTIGLVSFGGCAVGLISLGGLSLGVWAFGALTIGWQAFGACALAWNGAQAGIALAHDFALGGIARAMQANNAAAGLHFQQNPYFGTPRQLLRTLAWLNLLWVLPLLARWRIVSVARLKR